MSLKIRKNVKTLISKIGKQEDQMSFYKSQKSAFISLSSKKEFSYVISYWELEAEKAMSHLSNPKEENIFYRQARYNCATGFLSFVDNITSPDPAGLWDL